MKVDKVIAKNERQSNIELLRIVSIIMIVMFHIDLYILMTQLDGGVYANDDSFQFKLLILEIVMTFGQIGNDIFILITGYFLASKEKVEISKAVKKILIQMGFVSVLITILSFLYYKIVSDGFTGLVGVDIFNSGWWFAGYYIGIIVVAYFLNPRLQRMSQKSFLSLLLVLFAFVSTTFLGALLSGWTEELRRFVTGVLVYCLGGYIHKYNPFGKIKGIVLVLSIVVVYALLCLSYYNSTIEGLNISKVQGLGFNQSLDTFKVFSIVPFVIAILMFELFRRINMKSNAMINALASSSFMVYILHDNEFFRSLLGEYNLISLFYEHTGFFILFWVACSMAVFIIGFLVHIVFFKMKNKLTKYFLPD